LQACGNQNESYEKGFHICRFITLNITPGWEFCHKRRRYSVKKGIYRLNRAVQIEKVLSF
jgi:hypothetical protein